MTLTAPELQAIDAETQIFTPKYVSRFLAQNSIERIWVNSVSSSNSFIEKTGGFYVPSKNPEQLVKVGSPEEIRVLDPACGTGNLLVEAFDTLYGIYRDARYKEKDIPRLILSKNLFGYDIDAAAAEAAKAILLAKAHEKQSHFFRYNITPNIKAWSKDDHPDAGIYGTLLRELDAQKYHVILANPPYMGAKHFTPAMRNFFKKNYPLSKSDLATMFIERGHEMTVPGGMIAMVTPQSFMFLSSSEELRKKMLSENTFITMAHLGSGVFGSGAVISVTAFVQASFHAEKYPGIFFRLVDTPGKSKQRELQLKILEFRGTDEYSEKGPGSR